MGVVYETLYGERVKVAILEAGNTRLLIGKNKHLAFLAHRSETKEVCFPQSQIHVEVIGTKALFIADDGGTPSDPLPLAYGVAGLAEQKTTMGQAIVTLLFIKGDMISSV